MQQKGWRILFKNYKMSKIGTRVRAGIVREAVTTYYRWGFLCVFFSSRMEVYVISVSKYVVIFTSELSPESSAFYLYYSTDIGVLDRDLAVLDNV